MFTRVIEHALLDKKIKKKELAEKYGIRQQNLSQRLRQDDFREKEMQKIADILDMELVIELREKKR